MVVGIPNEWIPIFETNGIDLRPNLSRISFFLYFIRKVSQETLKSIYYLKPIPHKFFRQTKIFKKKILLHASFNDPAIFAEDPELYCFSNWYSEKYFKGSKIIFYNLCCKNKQDCLNFSLHPITNYLFPISFANQLKLLNYFFLEMAKLFVHFEMVNKFECFELSDRVLTERFRLTDEIFLPDVIIMNESSGYIIPQWVKYLKERGSSLEIFNFSISDSPLVDERQPKDFYPWSLLNWDNVKVIDKHQESYFKNHLLEVPNQTEITGVPFYTDKFFDISQMNEYLCLFDIRAKPNYFGISTLNEIGTNCFDYQEEILKTMIRFSFMTGIKVLYKQKRHTDLDFLNSETLTLVSQAEMVGLFKMIDHRVSPHKLIESSQGVVSQALTTTSLIAKQYGKPNIIVDLSSKLKQFDPCVRGIDIASDTESLLKWLFEKFPPSKLPEIKK